MAEGVLFLLHRLFGQRAAAFSLDDASSSDVTLMIVATLGLVLIVNAFLNIYASESQALAMLVRALLTIACLFILLLRAGFLKSGHLQSELEVLSRLHEQERRHYEHLKENMEAISIKCHDIKHFISSRMARAGIDNEELSELVRIYDTRIKTGNDTIDVLLSEQSLVCQRRNIRVTVLADASGLSFSCVSRCITACMAARSMASRFALNRLPSFGLPISRFSSPIGTINAPPTMTGGQGDTIFSCASSAKRRCIRACKSSARRWALVEFSLAFPLPAASFSFKSAARKSQY